LNERPASVPDNDESLMTPALRAALDALEHEFHDLVTAQALR
jgi:hypothetical protein